MPGPGILTSYVVKWEVIVCFDNIGEIVDHNYI